MRKPSLAVLIGMKHPTASKDMAADDDAPPSSRSGMKEEDAEGDSPHVDAAHGILDAVKSGDAASLADALETFYDLCKSGDKGDDDDRGY